MASKRKLTLTKKGEIIYTVKEGNSLIWEGRDIHRKFPVLKACNKGKELKVGWRSRQGFLSV